MSDTFRKLDKLRGLYWVAVASKASPKDLAILASKIKQLEKRQEKAAKHEQS
jgi:hypothetical protein